MCNLSLVLRASGNVIDSFITYCCWCIVQFVLAGALSAPKLNKKKHDGHGSLRAQSVLFFSRVLVEGLKNCFSLLFDTIVRLQSLGVHGAIFFLTQELCLSIKIG